MYINNQLQNHPDILSCINRYESCIEKTGYVLKNLDNKTVSPSDGDLEFNLLKLLSSITGKESITELRVTLRRYLELEGSVCLLVRYYKKTPVALEAHPTSSFAIRQVRGAVLTQHPLTGQEITIPRSMWSFTNASKGVTFQEFGDVTTLSGADSSARIYFISLPDRKARWQSLSASIRASQMAHEVNSNIIGNGGVAGSIITVAGANEDSVNQIREAVNRKTSDDQHVVLAASGTLGSLGGNAPGQTNIPSISHINLKTRPIDEQYKTFLEDVQQSIRGIFGLPDILFGRVSSAAFASIKAALEVCEETVFRPERDMIDGVINKVLIEPLSQGQLRYCSKPLHLLNGEAVAAILSTLTESGAITPNTAVNITNELFDLELPDINVKIGGNPIGDVPFSLLKLQQSTRSAEEESQDIVIGAYE